MNSSTSKPLYCSGCEATVRPTGSNDNKKGNETSRADPGLPWPDEFKALEPVIRESWGVQGNIYLNRLLAGKSGAQVYAADITSRDFTGQAILKFDRAPDADWSEEHEAELHQRAFDANSEFAEKHLAKFVHTAQHGDAVAMLSTIAGRGLEYARPWADSPFDRQVSSARQVSRGILEDWNRGYAVAEGLQEPQHLLESWLEYRLDPDEGRIYQFLTEECGLPADEPTVTFEGEWFPNPYAFARRVIPSPDTVRMRAAIGNQHGDLHGFNVLLPSEPKAKSNYHLIDLAMFRDDQYLFYDHGYFEFSELLLKRDTIGPEHWHSILDALSRFPHNLERASVKGDDLGLIRILRAVRREVFAWIDRHEPNRLSYLESQYILARLAVGLNFTNKPLTLHRRCLGFLYAASNLKDFLKLHGVDWPKYGPEFGFEGVVQTGVSSAQAESRYGAKPGPLAQATAHPSAVPPLQLILPTKPTIAVLPFDNLGGDPEQEYFTDGLTEEVMTELAKIDWLLVISRNSTFAYKGQTADPMRVGRELGVHYVVEGTVRRLGKRVRVLVQLLDADTAQHLWAERFDFDIDNIFEMEEEITRSIASHIDSELEGTERERARRKPVENLNAWDLYHRALWHFYKYSLSEHETIRALIAEAIEQEPDFAPPYALLSYLETREVIFGVAKDPDASLKSAMDHAAKAIELDERDSFAQTAKGRVYMLSGELDLALAGQETAIALNPSSSGAYLGLAQALCWAARFEEALPIIDMSIRLSPKDVRLGIMLLLKAACHHHLGDQEEAEKQARAAIRGHPTGSFGHALLAAILVRQGRLDEARAAVEKARQVRPDLSGSILAQVLNAYDPDHRKQVMEDIKKAGLPDT